MKARQKSKILDLVHRTAKGLHKIGLIDKRKMEKYNILCDLKPVPSYSPTQIKKLRSRYHISQAVLAEIINTSVSTVSKWEGGEKRPSGPSLKLLNILDIKGIQVFLIQDSHKPKPFRKPGQKKNTFKMAS